ncbi:hypothetical protein Zmor_010848 [Zophobas morio]|uniref:RAP domain-containing protein n=2 Tax=Zophobas morio TaxID=2755281 RepID=A0AA38IJK8_9CUCU|nr:hypothetical protein Zmor_010848 [Zophobas morio]
MCIKPLLFHLQCRYFKINNYGKCSAFNKFISTSAAHHLRIPAQDETPSDDDTAEIDDSYLNITTYEGYARDLLFKNSKDLLLRHIYHCASVQELLSVIDKNLNHFEHEHITQTVFVLHDLQRIYQDFSSSKTKNLSQSANEFFEKLQKEDHFQKLLTLTETKVHHFDSRTLSYCALYLNKLGLTIDTKTMQLLCDTLKKKLLDKFSLASTTRFLETVFSETSLRPFFMSQELMPLVFKEIELCASIEDLSNISVSLNKLHRVVTEESLDQYKTKVESLIANGFLTSKHYKVVLQIISFLNYPKWRDKNTVLISKCVSLVKDDVNNFNLNEVLILCEILFKIQEPSSVLNDLQRCSYKYFYQLEDFPTTQKISLLSILVFFTAPHMRSNFHKKLKKYVNECENYENLLVLRKLLSYLKVSDVSLCNLYWEKMLNVVKTEHRHIDILQISQNYVSFSSDIDNYRHLEFETEMLKHLSNLMKEVNCEFFPQKIASILSFVLLYGNDLSVLEYLVTKIENNWHQLKPNDCLKLAYTLRLFNETDKKYIKLSYARRIDEALSQYILKESASHHQDLWKNNALLKSCVYKNKVNMSEITSLLHIYKNFQYISSKNMENLFYCFLMTNTLFPELLENMIKYILTYKDHILGFNAGRVLYLSYSLGYHPKNTTEFCASVVDIIIRDQKRMTGLSIIYSALALCFYNKLPNSIIKSIFNVEFMDKLDSELQQCYSKDKYPNRVRNYLMRLNRAVCLDYPECNVPWFHQKYVDENIKGKNRQPSFFTLKIREHLLRIIQNKDALSENVVTPYGYQIDFVINLNSKDEVVHNESECVKRLALLLTPEYAYTTITSQLKGSFQLKKRHLEMLGYKVVFVKSSDWIGLYYTEDRIDYLEHLIWPKKFSEIKTQTFR